jgi:hypothetical protein
MKAYSFLNKILAESNADAVTLALKSEIDYLQGRNEELRSHVLILKGDLTKSQTTLIKAQDEVNIEMTTEEARGTKHRVNNLSIFKRSTDSTMTFVS